MAYLAGGVDVDVVLGLLRVRDEWLDEEVPQVALNMLDLLEPIRSLRNPLSRILPCRVELEKAGFTSPLDELIWFGDQLCSRSEQEWVGGLGTVKDALDIITLLKANGCEFGRRIVCCSCGQRGGLDDGCSGEVVVENGLAVGLEDCFGGHGACIVGLADSKTVSEDGEENVELEDSMVSGETLGHGACRCKCRRTPLYPSLLLRIGACVMMCTLKSCLLRQLEQ